MGMFHLMGKQTLLSVERVDIATEMQISQSKVQETLLWKGLTI